MDAMHCPICMEVFQLPIVQCTSGHSFCAGCIKEWLTRRQTCPLDNCFLDKNKLVRNLSLEAVIAEKQEGSKHSQGRKSPQPQRKYVKVPKRPVAPTHPLHRSFGACVMIFAVLVIGTAILFQLSSSSTSPAKPLFSTPAAPTPSPPAGQPTEHSTAYSTKHTTEYKTNTKIPFSSLVYQFCLYCADFIIGILGLALNLCVEILYFFLVALRFFEECIVSLLTKILQWNWISFFNAIIYCMKLMGGFLWIIGLTFLQIVKYMCLGTLSLCGLLLKGWVLMLHYGASAVLYILESVGM